jgi:hypothetical protein
MSESPTAHARGKRLTVERDATLLRTLVEIALLVSLFAIGLRLRVSLMNGGYRRRLPRRR